MHLAEKEKKTLTIFLCLIYPRLDPEKALSGVVTPEHVNVAAFELADCAMIEVRRYNQAILVCLG